MQQGFAKLVDNNEPVKAKAKLSLRESLGLALARTGLFHASGSPSVVNASENANNVKVAPTIEEMEKKWREQGLSEAQIEIEKMKVSIYLLQGSVADLYEKCGKAKDKKKKFKLKLGSEILESALGQGITALAEFNIVPGVKPTMEAARAAMSSVQEYRNSRRSFPEKIDILRQKLEEIIFYPGTGASPFAISPTQRTAIEGLIKKIDDAKKNKTGEKQITKEDIDRFRIDITTFDPVSHSQGSTHTRNAIIGYLTQFRGGNRTRRNKNRRRNRKTRSNRSYL